VSDLVRPDAERALIAAMLIDERQRRILRSLPAEAFLTDRHRAIWRAMLAVYERGEDLNLVTIGSQFSTDGTEDLTGGADYLQELAYRDALPTAATKDFADIVRDYWQRREIAAACALAVKELPRKKAVEAASALSTVIRKLRPMNSGISEAWRVVDELEQDRVETIETGFKMLDDLTDAGGLPLGEITLIGGTTGGGKSIIATAVCVNLAERGKRCLVWTLELDRLRIVRRMMRQLTGLKARWQGAAMWDEATEMLFQSGLLVGDHSLNLDNLTVETILNRTEELHEDRPLDLVVIDFVQLLTTQRRELKTNWEKQEHIAKSIRAFALSTGIPFLCLTQIKLVDGEPECKAYTGWKDLSAIFASILKKSDEKKDPRRRFWITKNRHGGENCWDVRVDTTNLRLVEVGDEYEAA